MQSLDMSGVLIALTVIVVAFLVLREVVLWYFNISKITQLLETQNELLAELIDITGGQKGKDGSTTRATSKMSFKESFLSALKIKRCSKCNMAHRITAKVCDGCGEPF